MVGSPRDTGSIVAAMNDLADPQRRDQCSQACKAAADSLSLARHVDELLAVYSAVGKQ